MANTAITCNSWTDYKAATQGGGATAASNTRQRERGVHFLQVYHDEAGRYRVQVLHLQHTLHSNRRAATAQGGRAHLEDVEAAAGQRQDFFLCRNSAREQQAAAVKRRGVADLRRCC